MVLILFDVVGPGILLLPLTLDEEPKSDRRIFFTSFLFIWLGLLPSICAIWIMSVKLILVGIFVDGVFKVAAAAVVIGVNSDVPGVVATRPVCFLVDAAFSFVCSNCCAVRPDDDVAVAA